VLTISGLERAMACQSSVLLPQTKSAMTTHAHYGTVVHAFLKDCNLRGRDEALADAPAEHREALAQIDTTRLPLDPKRWTPEISYAYGPESDTARELARGDGSRNYPTEPLLFGTADLVGLTDEAVIIIDWKGPHATLTPAKDNWQLKGYGLAAARAYGRQKAIGILARILDNGLPFFDAAEYGMFELDSAAEAIRALWVKLKAGIAGEPHEGEWCKWCPAFAACPAKVSLAVALGAGAPGFAHLDQNTAKAVYERSKSARAVLDRVDAALEDFARQHPIDLGNGFIYGEKLQPKESLDPLLSEPVLRAAGLQGAIQTIPRLTKDALEDEVRKQLATSGAKRGTLGKTVSSVLAALRGCGAATTAKQRIVTRFKPKPGELPATAAAAAVGEAPNSTQPSQEVSEVVDG
jgi:hypothetical protein